MNKGPTRGMCLECMFLKQRRVTDRYSSNLLIFDCLHHRAATKPNEAKRIGYMPFTPDWCPVQPKKEKKNEPQPIR